MLYELRESRKFRLFIILMLVPLLGSSIDIYVPSLPAIKHFFHAKESLTQLTVPMYLLGYSIAQIFCGSISDTYGRRKVLIIGLALYVIITLCAPFAANIYTLNIIRFLQGIAVSAPGVLVRAITSDTYSKEELPVVTNYITITWGLGPILAPMIGGYLQAFLGWQAPFYFLAIYGLIDLILVSFFLSETIKHFHAFKLKVLITNYKTILTHATFIGGIVLMAIFYGSLIFFNVIGPFIIQVELHYSPIVFGHIALILGSAWFLGSIANRLLIRHFNRNSIMNVALGTAFITSAIMLTIAIFNILNLYVIVIPLFIIFLAGPMVFTICFANSLSIFPEMAGTASAAMGSLFIAGAGLSGVVASLLTSTSQIPMATAYLILIFIAIFIKNTLLKSN